MLTMNTLIYNLGSAKANDKEPKSCFGKSFQL